MLQRERSALFWRLLPDWLQSRFFFGFLVFLGRVERFVHDEHWKFGGGVQVVAVVLANVRFRMHDQTRAVDDTDLRSLRSASQVLVRDGDLVGLVVAGLPARIFGHPDLQYSKLARFCQDNCTPRRNHLGTVPPKEWNVGGAMRISRHRSRECRRAGMVAGVLLDIRRRCCCFSCVAASARKSVLSWVG